MQLQSDKEQYFKKFAVSRKTSQNSASPFPFRNSVIQNSDQFCDEYLNKKLTKQYFEGKKERRNNNALKDLTTTLQNSTKGTDKKSTRSTKVSKCY